jgi:hypothetical protein
VIKLAWVSKIKSVFMLSIAPKMLSLESLTILHCDELEHIVVDCGDGGGGNELCNVFPKLKELDVSFCRKLEYIFGHINANDDHDQNNNKIHLHLPALKTLKLVYLRSLIGMSPKQYHIAFSSLKELKLSQCSQVDVKSIGETIKVRMLLSSFNVFYYFNFKISGQYNYQCIRTLLSMYFLLIFVKSFSFISIFSSLISVLGALVSNTLISIIYYYY